MKYKIEATYYISSQDLTLVDIDSQKDYPCEKVKINGVIYTVNCMSRAIKCFNDKNGEPLKSRELTIAIEGKHNFKKGDEVEI